MSSYYIYFINHKGNISSASINSETAKIIMDDYREIKLSEKWKRGDILFSEIYKEFAVFESECIFPDGAECYFVTNHGECVINKMIFKRDFRIATKEEITQFCKFLHSIGKEWDAEKKQFVNWKWKPKFNEKYWIITTTLYVDFFIWKESPIDIQMLDSGNYFKTEKEAKAMAKKIQDLLKGE